MNELQTFALVLGPCVLDWIIDHQAIFVVGRVVTGGKESPVMQDTTTATQKVGWE